jgi:hypothetical protein
LQYAGSLKDDDHAFPHGYWSSYELDEPLKPPSPKAIKLKFTALEPVTATFECGEWVILEGDPRAMLLLKGATRELGGSYFPSTWDFVNAVATKLGGQMLEAPPQDTGESPSDVVF